MKTFTCTSDKSYVKHLYKLYYENGNVVIFDDYITVKDMWMRIRGRGFTHIEVLDRIQKKEKPKRGFQ